MGARCSVARSMLMGTLVGGPDGASGESFGIKIRTANPGTLGLSRRR